MICILTHNQAKVWEETGNRPACEHHYHTSYKKANIQVLCDEAFWITGCRAIVIFPCILRYTWTGRSSGGYQVLQFAPVIDRKKHLPLVKEAR